MKLTNLLLSAILMSTSGIALAKDCGDRGKHKRDGYKAEFMQNLSEEERAQFKSMREKFKNMSKEERKAHKENVKSKWSELSKNEQDAFIAQHQDKIDSALERKKERIILRLYGMSLAQE